MVKDSSVLVRIPTGLIRIQIRFKIPAELIQDLDRIDQDSGRMTTRPSIP